MFQSQMKFKRICKQYLFLSEGKSLGNDKNRHFSTIFSQVLVFSRVMSLSSSILTAGEGSAFPAVLTPFLCLCICFLAQPVAVNSKIFVQCQNIPFYLKLQLDFIAAVEKMMNNSECMFSDLRSTYQYNLSLCHCSWRHSRRFISAITD